MRKHRAKIWLVSAAAVILGALGFTALAIRLRRKAQAAAGKNRWELLQERYQDDETVKQLVFVKYLGGSDARVELYTKKRRGWKRLLRCRAYVGRNGLGKQREGDEKTPIGDFALTGAYGIKENPGAKMDYVQVNPYLYWCGDECCYNKLIDIREEPHECSGEHLIDYAPQYNYGMFVGYNTDCIYGNGSAIFFHCTGDTKYTAGCIAVKEKNMVKILKNVEDGARICIYAK